MICIVVFTFNLYNLLIKTKCLFFMTVEIYIWCFKCTVDISIWSIKVLVYVVVFRI